MNATTLYRWMAIGALLLLAYATVELTYLGPLRFELTRRSGNVEQLSDLGGRASSAQAALASLPDVSQSEVAASFVDGTPDQALIALQEIVQGAVASAGAMQLAIQGSQTSIGPGIARLNVLVRASFSEAALLSFLREIESLPTLLSVQKLDVLPPAPGQVGSPGLDVTVMIGAIHSNAV